MLHRCDNFGIGPEACALALCTSVKQHQVDSCAEMSELPKCCCCRYITVAASKSLLLLQGYWQPQKGPLRLSKQYNHFTHSSPAKGPSRV
jgi:hypothetical protein